VIYFMVVGVVSTVMNASEDGTVLSDSSLARGADKWGRTTDRNGVIEYKGQPAKKPTGGILDAIGKIKDMFMLAFRLFWTGLTFDFGAGFPMIVRLFFAVPVVLLFFVVLLDEIIDLLKAVFKAPLSG